MTKDIKHFQKTKEKATGAQSGAIYQKQPQEKDAHKNNKHKFEAEWLIKTTSGYEMGAVNNIIAIEPRELRSVSAILQVYMGEIYQLLLPEQTPKMRLIQADDAPFFVNEGSNDADYYVASKIIPNVVQWSILSDAIKEELENGHSHMAGLSELTAIGRLMGDNDWNEGNVLVRQTTATHWNTYKVDPDDNAAKALNEVPLLTKEDFLPQSLDSYTQRHYPLNAFSKEGIITGLQRFADIDTQQLHAIAQKYEPLLDAYRKEKGTLTCYNNVLQMKKLAGEIAESLAQEMPPPSLHASNNDRKFQDLVKTDRQKNKQDIAQRPQ